MVLHLLTDDKFSDSIIAQFSAKEMMSDFVLLSKTDRMHYFHHVDKVSQIINPNVQSELNQLLKFVESYSTVVFHGLYHSWQEWLLNRWPENVKIAWVCWGGEIYGQPELQYAFLKPISRLAYWWYLKTHKRKEIPLFPTKLIKKAHYCLTNVEEEYEFVRNYLSTDIRHLSFNYYTIDDTIGTLKDKIVTGNNIFVGNAATIESNHIEILLKLKQLGIGERQIILPMSYGDPWVRNMVIRVGSALFREQLQPIVDFMPLNEYNGLMLDCSVMIQPHLREHAHGNIVTGLWLGMRVYLSEEGMDYRHFKKMGCKVYSIERDLRKKNKDVFSSMKEEDVIHNRQVLLSVYGREYIEAANKELVKELS